MTNSKSLKETEIAGITQTYLSQRGWKNYPEVVINGCNGRPDFVSTKGSLCQVTEVKKALSYPVIEQLTRWRIERELYSLRYPDQNVSSAIPHLLVAAIAGTPQISQLKESILRAHRIGVLCIAGAHESVSFGPDISGLSTVHNVIFEEARYKVIEYMSPRIQPGSRQTAHLITSQLQEDMMMGVAGSTGLADAYMTPFKRSLKRAMDYLSSLPSGQEVHVNVIVEAVNKAGGHHYCSDRGAAQGLIAAFKRLGYSVEHNRISVGSKSL